MESGGEGICKGQARGVGQAIPPCSSSGSLELMEPSYTEAEKNHDSQRRDRILRFFLRPEIGQLSSHTQTHTISLLTCTENLENRRKIHWRIFTNPVETAPRNCRFLSLVGKYITELNMNSWQLRVRCG